MQAQYERRRADFLARLGIPGEQPTGLGPRGLAGLLVPAEEGWVIRCYGVPRPAWSGWTDARVEAVREAYRLLIGSGGGGGLSQPTPRAEEEVDDAGGHLRAGLH